MTTPPHDNHLILMLKQPKRDSVKTRLAIGIGAGKATGFYRSTAHRLITTLSRDPRWRTFLAITPDHAVKGWPWPGGIAKQPQGRGNLGARMQRLFAAHAPHRVLIIGTDIPAITPAHIAAAFKAMAAKSVVIGPSGDGGYWCIGQSGKPAVRQIFQNVRWSSPHTLEDTIANISQAQLAFTAILQDIDDQNDYHRLYRQSAGRWFFQDG